MKKANRIVSFDWTMYDQGHVVYTPGADVGRTNCASATRGAYENFYAAAVDRQPLPAATASGIGRNG